MQKEITSCVVTLQSIVQNKMILDKTILKPRCCERLVQHYNLIFPLCLFSHLTSHYLMKVPLLEEHRKDCVNWFNLICSQLN